MPTTINCQPLSTYQLLHAIESIVLLGAIRVEELNAHLLLTTGYTPPPEDMQQAITVLTEKYDPAFYGIAFSAEAGLLQFTSRRITDIIHQ